ncbi:mannosyltransferase [Hydrococcus rivularis NIES-593]|uniref:Mannosyltransferase n=1 Tax=Hydrococcus rivularis NIES-593 TaxID=1921803 RepID=A0A1U7HHH1_9CYAN|nr:glycosyltransferase family 1 protein [Hydrococcus rivularis]OKH23033.1 mannosyltransferase [Hydrococcus rivularis NIES-593]
MHVAIAALHRPSKPTGVCRHAANLARALAQTNQVTKVTLIVGAWQKHYFETFFSSEKIELLDVDISNSSSARNLWFLFGLPKLVNRLRPDIIHMSFPFPFFRPLFSASVVSTIHDLYPYEKPEVFGYPNVIFNRLFLQQCVSNSDGLTCVSKTTLESFNRYFPKFHLRKAIAVTYNYVDFSQLVPKALARPELGENDPFLLWVAQHRKNKNIDLLIEAYSTLIKSDRLKPSTKLIIVGSPGPETENLHEQIQTLSLQDRVLLLSSIQDSELCWLYQNCEIFVAPSSQEGFCLPLAEALYFSCKVVCSDIPIFREIGSSSCIYFSLEGDPLNNLSQAIVQSLEQPSKKTSGDCRFSKSKVAEQYLALYSALK